ncbi:rifin PIR protein, putative [Plasmodium reichenowi]|uniref:Rifin PIR protein, putative n=1 Tax=Plasmodium reichenowi TaxID=5854 RepID=A0A2P9D400_PLARE|nr:rifin PIR protein, putative [Plasmodium reichenowi]
MKVHYINILLFVIPLNILITLYHVYNKNKIYITSHHTPRYTSRVLSECDTESSIYDNDAEIISVKENFERQTSQRFEEYEERMKVKRQKRKEQRDKNIQKIFHKDKMEKNLAEKIEKGCLRCGCGLGGVAASVGLFGGLGTYGWKSAAITSAIAEVTAKGLDAGAKEGVKVLINKLKNEVVLEKLFDLPLVDAITEENYFNAALISEGIKREYQSLCNTVSTCEKYHLFYHYKTMKNADGTQLLVDSAKRIVEEAVKEANKVTAQITKSQMETLEAGKLAQITDTSTYSYSAIGYSVLAILIIVLLMIIIYLVLRYRRKKKMKKKAQYTKLLNQ